MPALPTVCALSRTGATRTGRLLCPNTHRPVRNCHGSVAIHQVSSHFVRGSIGPTVRWIVRAQSSTRVTPAARTSADRRGMRTSIGCDTTRIPVPGPGRASIHTDGEPDTLARRLDGDETIMAAATVAERKTFAIFKWSLGALAAFVVVSLFMPAFVLGALMVLPVVAVSGSQWKTTREHIARRIERAAARANALPRRTWH